MMFQPIQGSVSHCQTYRPAVGTTVCILIVDDCPESLSFLAAILAEEGYAVNTATRADAAIEEVRNNPPDLILLDITLPDMDGYTLCQHLQVDERTCHIPIIFVSALDCGSVKARAFDAGGVDFITKPIQSGEAIARVQHQLKLQLLQKQLTEKTLLLHQERCELQTALRDRTLAEKTSRQAEAKYRSIFENAVEGIFQTTPDGCVISANPALARILGYDSPETLTHQLTNIGAQLYVEPTRRGEFLQALETMGRVDGFESQVSRCDGRIIWISESAHAIYNDLGQLVCYQGTVQDISQRKEAEAALISSERKYRDLVETSQDLVWCLDRDGRFTFINQAARQIYGCEPFDVIGSHLTEFLPPNRVVEELTLFQQLLAGSPQFRRETVHLKQNGQPVYLLMNAIAQRDANGAIVGATGTASDITGLKRTEVALRDSEARYRSLYKQTPVMLYSTDASFRLVSVSNTWLEFMDYGYEEIIGHSAIEFLTETSRRHALKVVWPAFLQTGKVKDVPYQVVKRNGEVADVLVSAIAEYNEAGDLVRSLAVMIDVTERNQVEAALRASEARERQKADELERTLEELKMAQSQLIQTEKMSSLGQMVAGIAHEINNPVSFIYGNISHAEDYVQDLLDLLSLYQDAYPEPTETITQAIAEADLAFITSDLQNLLRSMKVGSDRIRDIVQSLRSFSRMDRAAMHEVSLHDGIDSTLMLLQHRLRSQGSMPAIQIIKTFGNLPLVTCHAGQINQVFMNLLGNAIDALEARFCLKTDDVSKQSDTATDEIPTLSICTEQIASDRVAIRITDNGSGMNETVRSRIFDPFFTTKPVGRGTGIGLSISYQIIVEKHGGHLLCNSAPNVGTEFVIELPVAPV